MRLALLPKEKHTGVAGCENLCVHTSSDLGCQNLNQSLCGNPHPSHHGISAFRLRAESMQFTVSPVNIPGLPGTPTWPLPASAVQCSLGSCLLPWSHSTLCHGVGPFLSLGLYLTLPHLPCYPPAGSPPDSSACFPRCPSGGTHPSLLVPQTLGTVYRWL